MDYFKILNLNREPFSNSPDPDYFFFQSRQHVDCLQKVELAVRLCRGLNVVIGDVGTGKTTLCRRLIRNFTKEANIETHLILDPYFSTHLEFLTTVAELFGIENGGSDLSDWKFKEEIKKYLFKGAVDEGKIIVLIIDEGQKLSESCLEILREFLNYETNEKKLLQIVIFAQNEFRKSIEAHENFADRINLYHILGPLNFRDARAMIKFRLEIASSEGKSSVRFTLPALWAIYRASRGYPRKIINICHRAILTIIIQNRARVGLSVARFCIRKTLPGRRKIRPRVQIAVAAGGALILIYIFLQDQVPNSWRIGISSVSNKVVGDEKAEKGTAGKSYLKSGSEDSMPLRSGTVSAGFGDVSAQKKVSNSLTFGNKEDKKIPVFLGQIVVLQNDTLGNMIFNVYGIFNERYLSLVSEYNKDIKDPNHIESGRMIKFPSVRAEVRGPLLDYWWVKLTEKSSLEEAYRFLKVHSGSGLKLAVIPNWNRVDGLTFTVLYKKQFRDEKSARNVLNTLPDDFTQEAGLKDGWAEGTVFFANPVF
ncbi:ExeA family protein [Thermodesulfobacteriota bacterium]